MEFLRKRVMRTALLWIAVAGCSPKAAPPKSSQVEVGAAEMSRVHIRSTCIERLHARYASTVWTTSEGYFADVTFDGAAEQLLWGESGDSLVLAISECGDNDAARSWLLPFNMQGEWDSLGVTITLENPSFGTLTEGWLYETCLGREASAECQQLAAESRALQRAYEQGGRGFRVGPLDRHGLHFYWCDAAERFISQEFEDCRAA